MNDRTSHTPRTRLLIALGCIAASLAVLAAVRTSLASFTSENTTSIVATTDTIRNHVHLYTESTDPDRVGGYFAREGTTAPAAEGVDDTVTVDFGSFDTTAEPVVAPRVFSMWTKTVLPAGLTTVTVTATTVPDPETGLQPLARVGVASFGNDSVDAEQLSMVASETAQVNVLLDLTSLEPDEVCAPRILITLTYEGMEATYYQYSVPVSVAVR